jgi:methylmalonyl-CoA mutase cobalamin-binding domain/chain
MAPAVDARLQQGLGDYEAALATGDARGALAVIDGLIDAGVEFDDLCEEIIRPALYEIGRLWETGRIGVADEHLATSISETVLACMGAIWSTPIDAEPRVLVCTSDGEAHAVGARMVAEAFAAADWSVQYLGASTPADAVASAVVERGADVLALSTTMSGNLPAAEETIALARAAAGELCVIVGGQAYGGDPRRAERLGAELYQEGLRGLVERVESSLAADA